jgi:Htaa
MIEEATATSTPEGATIASGLYWAIKSSFVSYVASTAGGTHSMSAEVEVDDTGTFLFPLEGAEQHESEWTLRFIGDVRFSGHFGMLFVAIVDPWLTVSAAGRGELSIADVAAASGGGRIVIASIESAAPLPHAGYLVWPPLTPELSHEGAELFGGAYPEGQALDPLRIAIRESNIR